MTGFLGDRVFGFFQLNPKATKGFLRLGLEISSVDQLLSRGDQSKRLRTSSHDSGESVRCSSSSRPPIDEVAGNANEQHFASDYGRMDINELNDEPEIGLGER